MRIYVAIRVPDFFFFGFYFSFCFTLRCKVVSGTPTVENNDYQTVALKLSRENINKHTLVGHSAD